MGLMGKEVQRMAKILNCRDMDFECDFLCADSEEDLFNRAAQYAKTAQNLREVPSEFRAWVRAAMKDVDHC
jgi:predicted small metal-binding protein